MNTTSATRLRFGGIAVGALIGAAIVGASTAWADPPVPMICKHHVEYLDRPFWVKALPGSAIEIHVTACVIGPGNGGPDEVVAPTP